MCLHNYQEKLIVDVEHDIDTTTTRLDFVHVRSLPLIKSML